MASVEYEIFCKDCYNIESTGRKIKHSCPKCGSNNVSVIRNNLE